MANGESDRQRYETIYNSRADDYHCLVMHEDWQGALPLALREIAEFSRGTIVEFGAGTGRVTRLVAPIAGQVLSFDRSEHMLQRARTYMVQEGIGNVRLAVADSRSLPLPDATGDIAIEGWSFGHTITDAGDAWRETADQLIGEGLRVLKPAGTLILIETLGTGRRTPCAPGSVFPLLFAHLQADLGFSHRWVRTDYRFESMEKAERLMRMFFGGMTELEQARDGAVIVPECTGIWWKRKE